MAVKFTKVCGSNRPRTKLDFGRVTKKVTKISDPGCCGVSKGTTLSLPYLPPCALAYSENNEVKHRT